MRSDYEVLGLQEGADEKEIKRAYFKLVRQFTPEKNPERFQEIREAYENLGKGNTQTQMKLKLPEDAFAQKMFEQIETLYRQHNYRMAEKTAEEAIGYYGECEGFLYYLALSQRKMYYSGKAVKNLEKLVKLSPDNIEFAKELAISYLDRGYGKKAYAAFGKAYEMGCRDIEFLDCYAMNCRERKDFTRGIALLLEVIDQGNADKKKYMLNLLDANAGLFIMSLKAGGERIDEIKDVFEKFLEAAGPYIPDYIDDLPDVFRTIMYVLRSMRKMEDGYEERLQDKLKKGIGAKRTDELWKRAAENVEGMLLKGDSRISNTMILTYSAFMFDDYEPEESRFSKLDSKLCILEEWPGIKEELEIIKEDYPVFYDAIREYVSTLEQTNNIDYLREKLKKDYDRLERYISGGQYYEEYPQRRTTTEIISEGGYGMDPYTRMQPKVGRNDPCPCGSGKKYKKCCGR